MQFNDIFKKAFLEGWASSEIAPLAAIVTITVTSFLALYIFLVYRLVTKKTFYSKTFNISLACVSIITSAIILTVQSSIVISLGMVGALSIVRFRTAIKDPLDLMFLFWSISIGIICGAGLAEIAVILSLALTAAIIILDKIPLKKDSMLLIVNSNDINIESLIMSKVKEHSKYSTIKSRNMTQNNLDLVIELRTDSASKFLQEITALNGVVSASLLSDGETINL